jgi:hypothetical protein
MTPNAIPTEATDKGAPGKDSDSGVGSGEKVDVGVGAVVGVGVVGFSVGLEVVLASAILKWYIELLRKQEQPTDLKQKDL